MFKVGDTVRIKRNNLIAVVAFSGLHFGHVGVRIKPGAPITFLKPEAVEEVLIIQFAS